MILLMLCKDFNSSNTVQRITIGEVYLYLNMQPDLQLRHKCLQHLQYLQNTGFAGHSQLQQQAKDAFAHNTGIISSQCTNK